MNCKNSAQNALNVAIFRLKIENFSGEGAMHFYISGDGDTPSPNSTPLGAFGDWILAPSALDLAPRLQILDPPLLAMDVQKRTKLKYWGISNRITGGRVRHIPPD